MDHDSKFSGPLFIVGMQRSGTKLLRTLMSEHPKVNIVSAETHFLPHWVKVWPQFGNLSDPKVFEKFYRDMQKSPYFIYTKNRNSVERQRRWYSMCKSFTVQGVYEALMRCDADIEYSENMIWGDKSTSYLNHMPLLKELFPESKFIHIIRDVRDYSLSVYKAWKKNKFRASQRWVDNITEARASVQHFQDDYYEIRYEDLLDDPEDHLAECCKFLDIEPNASMLTLSRAPENIGEAKGYQHIKFDNKNKYLANMDMKTRQRIEAIAGATLHSLNYETDYSGKPFRLSPLEMTFYRMTDGANLILQEAGRNGLLEAIKIEIGSYMTSRVQK